MSESKLNVTREFLEGVLGIPVESFGVSCGPDTGDNYMSVIYYIKVVLLPPGRAKKSVHLVAKCFPSHPVRQKFLVNRNIFWKELCVYKIWIPEMKMLQKDLQIEPMLKLPFAPLISGQAIDSVPAKDGEQNNNRGTKKHYDPFDMYLLMVDMQQTFGFRMADRRMGLDWEHCALVVEAHAKIHALSWAYKQKHGITQLNSKYPFLDYNFSNLKERIMWGRVMESNCERTLDALREVLGQSSEVINGTLKIKSKGLDIVEAFFGNNRDKEDQLESLLRVPPVVTSEEESNLEPWRVVIHGDCWINNLLFRYVGAKPVEVTLVDLQICREACPTTDLVYLVYTSTDESFRKTHLDTLLQTYHDHFVAYCTLLNVDLLPGFSMPMLKRRFHRSKLLGYCLAMMCLPIILNDSDDVPDLDQVQHTEGMDMGDLLQSLMESTGDNFKQRIVGVANDMYADGVI